MGAGSPTATAGPPVTEPGKGIGSRQELARLIQGGLMGRTLKKLFVQLVAAFHKAGQELSVETFYSWTGGARFPANRLRQELLAEVVGGPCGEAIKRLPSPAFRGYRRRVMRETEVKMGTHQQAGLEYRRKRQFPVISIKSEDGRTHHRPVIRCIDCGTKETAVRNGSVNDDELFRKKGWEVGRTETHDYCPMCVKARNTKEKVVKMEDHVKKNGEAAAPSPVMSKEDGRIISRLIEDRWDEASACYKPGWSDAKLAEEVGRPVEWIRQRRELDFGGTGEDPGIVDFLKAQVALNTDLAGLRTEMDQLAGSVSELASLNQKVQRQLEKYRDGHNALATKATRLQEVAGKLTPPFTERKAG